MNQWMKCKKEIQIYVFDKKRKRKDVIYLKNFFVLWRNYEPLSFRVMKIGIYRLVSSAYYALMGDKKHEELYNILN